MSFILIVIHAGIKTKFPPLIFFLFFIFLVDCPLHFLALGIFRAYCPALAQK